MARHPWARAKAYVARGTGRIVGRLGVRRGMLGRVARALDEELNLDYLARIAEHEDALIDRIVALGRASSRLRVSIVVPTHGVGLGYVKELVASVERQTHSHWELCFADDCDPEAGVAAWLRGLADGRSDRYKYVRHDQHRGIAAATRTGVSLASGDLIAFVDADDLLHARALEAVVSRFAADERIDCVYTDHDFTTDLGFRRAPIRKPGFSPELLQSVNYVNHLVVVRKSWLDACEGAFADESAGGQDWDLCLRLVTSARKVSHVAAVLYHWRARPGSLAAGSAAKPWVRAACRAAQLRHLGETDERLGLAEVATERGHHYEPALRAEVASPPLRMIAITRREAEPRTPSGYDGPCETIELRLHADTTNGDVVSGLRERCGVDSDALVWLVETARPLPVGSLRHAIAFALQGRVGTVGPFRSDAVRLCYSLMHGRLVPVTEPTSAFARFSGNVLCGPLHGLLVRAASLHAALADLADAQFQASAAHPDSIGASIGLAMVAAGRRNVACRGTMCDVALEDPLVPARLVPKTDSWA